MRSKKAPHRLTAPDPVYNNRLLAKLINRSMHGGKKTLAQKHIYTALDIVAKETKQDPLEVFRSAVDSIKPQMEVRSRRVGGAAYQVPTPVRGNRKESLAIRWLVSAARKRSNTTYHTYAEKLAAELIAATKNEGEAIKKRDDAHRMAESNKAFSHFRW